MWIYFNKFGTIQKQLVHGTPARQGVAGEFTIYCYFKDIDTSIYTTATISLRRPSGELITTAYPMTIGNETFTKLDTEHDIYPFVSGNTYPVYKFTVNDAAIFSESGLYSATIKLYSSATSFVSGLCEFVVEEAVFNDSPDISLNQYEALVQAIGAKQNALTAGDNIQINNNTISATNVVTTNTNQNITGKKTFKDKVTIKTDNEDSWQISNNSQYNTLIIEGHPNGGGNGSVKVQIDNSKSIVAADSFVPKTTETEDLGSIDAIWNKAFVNTLTDGVNTINVEDIAEQVPTITFGLGNVVGNPGTHGSSHHFTLSTNATQQAILENDNNGIIKVDLSILYNISSSYFPVPYLWLKRNVKQTMEGLTLHQFSFDDNGYDYSKAFTENHIDILEMGNGGAIYEATSTKYLFVAFEQLALDATLTRIYNCEQNISAINAKIPSAASSSNQLADKDYVKEEVDKYAAYYITKNADGDAFATKADLLAATVFYSGGEVRIPTRNDFCYVNSDEQHANAMCKYGYEGGTYPSGQWEFQVKVNDTPFTQAQINAINSGITSSKVLTYDGYAPTIASKSIVSGTNDGTNWQTITINGTTKNIPTGGGGGGATNIKNGTGNKSIIQDGDTSSFVVDNPNATNNGQTVNAESSGSKSSAVFNGSSRATGSRAFASGAKSQAIGDRSTAMGNQAVAEGTNSFANGNQTTAKGFASFANGNKTLAQGINSFSGGDSTKAKADNSFAVGQNTEANGSMSAVFGKYTYIGTTDPQYTIPEESGNGENGEGSQQGNQNNQNADMSFAINDHCVVLSPNSFAGGYYSKVGLGASGSFAFGNGNLISHKDCVAIGIRLITKNQNQFVIGRYNDYSTPIDALFVIGSGTSANRKNAFFVKENGTVFCSYLTDGTTTKTITQVLAGSVPSNMVTTDTTQTVSGQKTFSEPIITDAIINSSSANYAFGFDATLAGPTIAVGDNAVTFNGTTFFADPTNENSTDLGKSNAKWKDIYLSGQVKTDGGIATTTDGGATSIGLKLWKGTQAQYDSITTPDANTLYIIV